MTSATMRHSPEPEIFRLTLLSCFGLTFTPIPSAALSTAPMGSDPGLRMNTSGVAQEESSKHALRSNTGGFTNRSPIFDTTNVWTPVATLSARMHLRAAAAAARRPGWKSQGSGPG